MSANVGREALKWLASLGSGTLTALAVGILVEVVRLDPTQPLDGAVVVAVGTLCVKFVGWATAKYGPTPVKARASRARKRKANGASPLKPDDSGDHQLGQVFTVRGKGLEG